MEFNPLRIRATRNPATGEITCDHAGGNWHGDISAQWYPDAETDFEDAAGD
jgi:hypothetical protein